MSNDALGHCLLLLARNAIARELGIPPSPLPARVPEALDEKGATFVTLTQQGELRGCMGSLEAWRPLQRDVEENARASAFRDPRFNPLAAAELPNIRVEASLLTAPSPMSFQDEADALNQLRPGVDGIIFHAGGRRATFLPQVWESLPDPARFMAQLKQKAGLHPSYWGPDVRLERYAVQKWKEAAP